MTLLPNAPDEGEGADKTSRLYNQLALYVEVRADYAMSERLKRRALAIGEAADGPDHPTVAVNLNNLATLLQDTNRLAEAEPLMRRAARIFEASLGPVHPNTQTVRRNLDALLTQIAHS